MPHRFQVTDTTTMPLESHPEQQSKKVWVNFLPNIDLGHMLTMIGFGIAFAAQWNIQDRRITIAETAVQQQKVEITDIKGDLKEIKAVVINIQLQQAANNAVRGVVGAK